ncbi:hypothetical protein CPT_Moabite_020 [Serratia phage Moabite]|uniref:Uncharacterized protein n=3 Tax=Moabitevirus TaxID=2843422 RepID=A0A7T3TM07_9CAUD|nr:hypothetical protein HWB23_gp290 [Serratia phage vB_SmaM_ 2050HW]YP_009849116.1 hypothetical protein HWC48_gp020 [Serratia phage Moabite]QPX76797.1 hypothetical protein [Serratia phage vB_SmaM_Yaphecito]UCR74563.1 hypothetical protein [Serratia phage BUCT660]UGO54238.1 hypothetical protein HAYMO_256 [Serratia phage vB_SmaM_Haymo]UQT03744.1 hypothetical protein KODAMA_02770 [Serratia phage vB_SmaM-Kodama]URG14134.1 hypothetical protein [Pectobacterium phage vB_ParM-25]
MAKSNENEVAFFFQITPETRQTLLETPDYLIITQSEIQTVADNGLRLTNRVRRTEAVQAKTSVGVVFECATKYRFPGKPGDMTSRCLEREFQVSEEEYELALPFGERVYHKRRFSFNLAGFEADLDWFVEKESNDFGEWVKLDINVPEEGITDSKLYQLLTKLPQSGITIANLINPPGIYNERIKSTISDLMQNTWNLA